MVAPQPPGEWGGGGAGGKACALWVGGGGGGGGVGSGVSILGDWAASARRPSGTASAGPSRQRVAIRD